MKRRAPRRRYYPQRRRRKTAARPSRRTIRKKPKSESSKPAVLKPTYFSLLADVEHALKVEHTEGASLQKLKRDLEQKYGGRKFDLASNKMFNSAVKRLRNRGRIAKIHPNSSLFKFKPPVVPPYNFFGPGPASRAPFRLPDPPAGRQLSIGKRSTSVSRSVTMSRSKSRSGSGSRPSISRSISRSNISRSTTRGSRSISRSMSRSMSRSPNSIGKPPKPAALHLRKPMSSVKRSRPTIRRRRY